MKKPMKKPLFEDAVRRNWGWWDGISAARTNRRPLWDGKDHFDPVYAAAYWAGYRGESHPNNAACVPGSDTFAYLGGNHP